MTRRDHIGRRRETSRSARLRGRHPLPMLQLYRYFDEVLYLFPILYTPAPFAATSENRDHEKTYTYIYPVHDAPYPIYYIIGNICVIGAPVNRLIIDRATD